MAGRGTDIKLGEGVPEIGGLKIIGTERHESRRIDNQLRGRAGRQGDPGESRFFISLEDDLMRLFGSEKTIKLIDAMGLDEDEPIEHKMLTKAIEGAQKKVEGNNFATRKHLLEYDEIMIDSIVDKAVDVHLGESQFAEEWDMNSFNEYLNAIMPIGIIKIAEDKVQETTREQFKEDIRNVAHTFYEFKEKEIGDEEKMRELERSVLLRVIDMKWMDHIDAMDHMRQGIGLHAYAQRDPLIEYKFASYDMFDALSNEIQEETVKVLSHIKIVTEEDIERKEVAKPISTNKDDSLKKKGVVKSEEEKIGRNDPCPCGSGKKYKQCCGKNA